MAIGNTDTPTMTVELRPELVGAVEQLNDFVAPG